MSVIVKRRDDSSPDLPANYEQCSKEEALEYQSKLVREWKPKSEVWAFRYSPLAYSLTAAFTGGLISSFVRRRLKLQHYGRVAMLLPTMGIPGAFTPVLQQQSVTAPLLLQSECPVCLQIRSMLIQNSMALGYPIVIASASGLFLAERYGTYRLPEFFIRTLPEFVKIAKNILMRHKNSIIGLAVFNTLLAGFLTDRQASNLFYIARKKFDESDES